MDLHVGGLRNGHINVMQGIYDANEACIFAAVMMFAVSLKTLNLSIDEEGAKALAKALEPRQQPDGTWVSV